MVPQRERNGESAGFARAHEGFWQLSPVSARCLRFPTTAGPWSESEPVGRMTGNPEVMLSVRTHHSFFRQYRVYVIRVSAGVRGRSRAVALLETKRKTVEFLGI